jgi:hypothetical protein
MADPAARDPAEGSRQTIDRELGRDGAKNPEREAENPGGTPTETVKASAPARPREPEGQQGTTMPKDH